MNLRFTEKYVLMAPEDPGIFCLWQHANLVYVGRTAPRTNLREELRDYFERWGSLPRYNESAPVHHEGALQRAGREA